MKIYNRQLQWDDWDIPDLPTFEDVASIAYIVKYVVLEVFLLFGLFSSFYVPLMTHILLKKYESKGEQIEGQILACDSYEGTNGGWNNNSTSAWTWMPFFGVNQRREVELSVLYEARQHKYNNNPSMKFRYPNSYLKKRFLRRFHIVVPATSGDCSTGDSNDMHQKTWQRGDYIQMLLLRNNPRSGFLKQEVEKMSQIFSWCRFWMMFIPVCILLCVMALCAIKELKENTNEGDSQRTWHLVTLVVAWFIIFFVLWTKQERRFQELKAKQFFSAVAVSSVETSETSRSPSSRGQCNCRCTGCCCSLPLPKQNDNLTQCPNSNRYHCGSFMQPDAAPSRSGPSVLDNSSQKGRESLLAPIS